MSKSWFICFLLMIFIAGAACFWEIDPSVSCPDPNDPQCKHLFNKDMKPSFPEKEYDVPSFCSKMDDYYKCIDANYTAEKLCGRPLVMKSAETMVGEFCSKRTTFYKRFLASVECLKRILNLASGICQDRAFSSMRTLKDIPGSTIFETKERLERCFIKTYETECYGTQTMAACGMESHTTFKEISMRSSYYTADCRDYKEFYKSYEAILFLSEHSKLQVLRYPGESLPSEIM
ncbi:uncharacterized protein TNIN_5581 [Trichonephila inaurata madagascariensis]|uniref:DUF19 domain-containing protein n=1 Tax=Trichonephila inaurata madagascariensis TaxID=2747483 RepID=A0A8X7CDK7_9ARAC|nr:uncharacterized protein TNIN_5581 [Trichonephila inaurata madagascariensis]